MPDKVLIGIEWEPQITLLEFPNLPVNFRASLIESNIGIFDEGKNILVSIKDGLFRNYHTGDFTDNHCFLSTDQVKQNIELRTFPTAFHQLEDQILLCNKYLKHFILKLRQRTNNGIGVFLPKAILAESDGIGFMDDRDVYHFLEYSTPSKHVNISFRGDNKLSMVTNSMLRNLDELPNRLNKSKEYKSIRAFRTFIKTRISTADYGERLHITVPYNFTEYKKLIPFAKKLWNSDEQDWFLNYINLAQFLDNWYKTNEPEGPKLISYIKKDKYVTTGGLI